MRLILAFGFTLFEVLVSLLLLSIALLGLDLMEISASRLNLKVYYASLAEQQLGNMEERLRMLGTQGGLVRQIELWNQENNKILPRGSGLVSGAYPFYTITLFWGEQPRQSCEKSTEEHAGCLRENFRL